MPSLSEMAAQIETPNLHGVDITDADLPENLQPKQPGPGRLTTAKQALDFILAGNAYFTVRSEKTGTRYTFRVSRAKQTEQNNWKGIWFVSLLTGPQNTEDYSYMGAIREDTRVFKLTKASRMTEDAPSVKAFRWVFEQLKLNRIHADLSIWHEGRCGRCGRKLTVPESVENGLGPECLSRMGGSL